MKLLITGGSGMLGSYTAAQATQSGWETWATYTEHPVRIDDCQILRLDIRDSTAVAETISDIRPDVIIHTAALVRPDVCEKQKSDAFAVNVMGTWNIAAAAEKIGAHLVHVSTDTVFDGTCSPIMPEDPVTPVNYYGLTKAAAEAAVSASDLDCAVVRTSIIYGPRMFPFLESFSDSVLSALRAGESFAAFENQYRSPIPAWNLADVLLEIAERRLTGIFHAVCPEVSSRLQFARKIADVFGLDDSLIIAKSMDETETIARRPKMLVLDTVSTARTLSTRLLGFEEGILELKHRME